MPDPVLVQAFCQVDTIKGNRYLDDAGKIMNEYDADFPEKRVGLDGLNMINKDSPISQINVTVNRVWVSFTRPDTLQYVQDHARRIITRICELIVVTDATRFGLRTEHLVLIPDDLLLVRETARNLLHADLLPTRLNSLTSFESVIEVEHSQFLTTSTRIHPARRLDNVSDDDRFPPFGIMLDTDSFRKDQSVPLTDLRKFLRAAVSNLNSSLPALAIHVVSEVPQ